MQQPDSQYLRKRDVAGEGFIGKALGARPQPPRNRVAESVTDDDEPASERDEESGRLKRFIPGRVDPTKATKLAALKREIKDQRVKLREERREFQQQKRQCAADIGKAKARVQEAKVDLIDAKSTFRNVRKENN